MACQLQFPQLAKHQEEKAAEKKKKGGKKGGGGKDKKGKGGGGKDKKGKGAGQQQAQLAQHADQSGELDARMLSALIAGES
jgi:hypothetical protein